MRDQSGNELCYISHPNYDRRITCNIFGHLGMSENWAGWEVWRFSKSGDDDTFVITSWTHHKKVLRSDGAGRVFTTENEDGNWEKWRVVKHPTREGVMIESVEHGGFLAFSGHDLYTMDKENDSSWFIEPATNHFFISNVSHDRRLSSSDKNPFTSENRKDWEKWIIQPDGDMGEFSIRSVTHGKYLHSVENDDELVVNEYKHLWIIKSSPHGGMSAEAIASGGGVIAGGTVATLQSIGAAGLGVGLASASVASGAVMGGLSSLGVAAACQDKESSTTVLEHSKHYPLCSWRLWS
ncbi:hypothetical protein ACHAWO_008936 [Cyclotella atomus]|uniref:Fascin domain-containing protein n=1 Tax=Cyclotella atomus TaxID=382360 RepID=A0ABD3QPF4_9STRA